MERRKAAVTNALTLQFAKKNKKINAKIYEQELRISHVAEKKTMTDVDTDYNRLSLLNAEVEPPSSAEIPPTLLIYPDAENYNLEDDQSLMGESLAASVIMGYRPLRSIDDNDMIPLAQVVADRPSPKPNPDPTPD